MEKCVIQIIKSGKRQMMEEIEQPNQEKYQNALRKGHLQIFGNVGS